MRTLCVVAALSGVSVRADELPGLGWSATRVVLMAESRGGAGVTFRNNSDAVYLLQTRVMAADANTGIPVDAASGTPPPPFMVIPPLQRLEAHGKQPLRILASPSAKAQLPADRESVFFLAAKAIPSVPAPGDKGRDSKGTSPEKTGGQLVLALVNNIKLFYRPAGLQAMAVGKIAGTLAFARQGDRLQVSNPSGYYATFAALSVGGKPVSPEALRAMVPPKGVQTYPLPAGGAGEVRWRLIDEYGLPTDEQHDALR